MTPARDPLLEVEELTGDLQAIENRRNQALLRARAAGTPAQDIANAANMSPATYYRILSAQREDATDPTRYRHYAPHLALDQPSSGLSVAIGTNPHHGPLATFTFDERHPMLLLLHDPNSPQSPDFWPTIAVSATVSNARVGIYGRRPTRRQSGDLPTYFGTSGGLYEYPAGPELLRDEIKERIDRIAAGEDIAPILIALTPSTKALVLINTAIVYGHSARLYVIVEADQWRPEFAVITSTLAASTLRGNGPWNTMIKHTGLGPQMPTRFGTAMLTTAEGATEILLPTDG